MAVQINIGIRSGVIPGALSRMMVASMFMPLRIEDMPAKIIPKTAKSKPIGSYAEAKGG